MSKFNQEVKDLVSYGLKTTSFYETKLSLETLKTGYTELEVKGKMFKIFVTNTLKTETGGRGIVVRWVVCNEADQLIKKRYRVVVCKPVDGTGVEPFGLLIRDKEYINFMEKNFEEW